MRKALARHLAVWSVGFMALSFITISTTGSAGAASATSQVWCTNTFAPTVKFNLPVSLDTTVTGAPVAPGGSFSVDVQATIPLSEGFIQGVLTQVPSLTEVTVNRVFISVAPPANATGSSLDIEFSPGVVAITSAPGVPIPGGVELTSPVVSGTFTATGSAGQFADFELDPSAAGSPDAAAAGGTVWGAGGVAAAIELDLTILAVVKVGFDCTDGALTQSPGPDGTLGTGDDVFAPPVTDNPPFLSVPIEDGGTTTSSGDTTSTSSSSSSSSSSSTSSTSTSSSSSSSTTSSTSSSTTVPETTSTTAPPALHLPSKSVDVAYECTGADADTDTLLKGLGDGTIELAVALSNGSVESPALGESFSLPLRWRLTLDQAVIDTAAGLGITAIQISDTKLTAGAGTGLSGPDFTARPSARSISLGGGSASFTEGPFEATFVRESEVGEPVTVVAKAIALVATIDLGGPVPLALGCLPQGPASLTLVDVEGPIPPEETTTSTTLLAAEPVEDPEVLGVSAAPADGSSSLPVTGAGLWPIFLAGVLIDMGYLARSASRPGRRTT